MSCLSVVNGPAIGVVRKCLLKTLDVWSGDTDFYELALVDEDLEVVATTLYKYLSANGSLEAITLSRYTSSPFRIHLDLRTSFVRIPCKDT